MKASKRFATLYEKAQLAELRLVVVLVPGSVADGTLIEYNEYGVDQAGDDLDAALNKVEAFLDLPSVQAVTEALAERKIYVEQANRALVNLNAVEVSLARFEEDAMVEAAKISGK